LFPSRWTQADLTSSNSINPLQSINRVINTVSDVWHGVSSAGVVTEWLSEGSESADASPTLAEPAITAYKLSVFVPFSVELQGDATALMGQLGRLLQDGANQLLNTALTTGSGTGQPVGIVSALAGTGSQVNTATGDTSVSGDVYALQNALPPKFSADAQWCANLAVLNMLRQMETSAGALKFPAMQDNPPVLLGRPANELSNTWRSILSRLHFDHHAREIIADEIAECPHCWREIAEHLADHLTRIPFTRTLQLIQSGQGLVEQSLLSDRRCARRSFPSRDQRRNCSTPSSSTHPSPSPDRAL
jgi:hypothetical protein